MTKLRYLAGCVKRGWQIMRDIRGHGVRDPFALFRFALLGATPWPRLWDKLSIWPLEVALETTDYCNLRCTMCPVTFLERPRGMMTKELFHQMVDQCVGRGDFLFFPQGFGEGLLHPDWKEMLEYAKNRGIQPITLITNGMLLNAERVEHILDLKIDSMCCSVDGVTNETYAKIRVKGDLDKVVHNVKNLLRRRGERGQSEPAVLMRIIQMPQTEHEVDAFLDMWRKNLGPQDGVAVNPYTSWAGLMDEEVGAASNGNGNGGNGTPAPVLVDALPPPPPAALEPPSAVPTGVPGVGVRGPCRMLWKNFTVLYDGRVTPCCIDAEGELIIGDVKKSSIKELWHGAQLKRLRELHKKREWDKIPICARCREWI